MPEMVTTTSEQFGQFKEAFDLWVRELGLHGWSIEYGLEDLLDEMATMQISLEDRQATVYLSTTLDNDDDVESVALHEVLELLLARCNGFMRSDHMDERFIEEAIHDVIHRLQRILAGAF